ncbi:SxtJ family membrane protein [Paracoccus sediminicola]|uniref:SxtJ family membrane protein n=1 Tax=Paracoccus sediminicola TaxID=3017783 RepID=UPI0022F081A4|nr:SxtJ family membrane protein [Paracoccus sediminicola]WBU56667.1 SxtJ family membrane protein [Paracoccus sediminicola]
MGSERGFGLVFAAVFALIGLWPLLGGDSPRWIVLAIAAVFLALSFAAPHLLRVPNQLWFKLGILLGAIVAPIVMALVYLVAFIPIGMMLRVSGKDLLALEMKPDAQSYWIRRNDPPKSMKLQY